jgi:lipopolysaccharide/colanic/teichoic acid biosynthesis glycosyltransferase
VRIKRLFDIVVSVVALAVGWPLMLAVAVAIKLTSPGDVFFRHRRVGLGGKEFDVLKFRSMEMIPEDSECRRLGQDPAITRIGGILRMIGLDELPQLCNVLCGDMSIVGPRPLMAHSLRPEDGKRLLMRPGITGPVAAKGAVALTWEDRTALDVWYVENWTFWLDLRIILQTVFVVLSATNIDRIEGEKRGRSGAARN